MMPTIFVMGWITIVWVSFWKRRAPIERIMHVKQVVKSYSMADSCKVELMFTRAYATRVLHPMVASSLVDNTLLGAAPFKHS